MVSHYLADIIIMLVAAVSVVPVFQYARFGAVPGFLVAGVIVGPSGLGLIDNVEEIADLAEIGVVLLLFVIGIELKPSRLWLMRRFVFGLGAIQVLVTGVLLGCTAFFLFDVPLRASILIGPALALSSTAFVLQLLTEQKLLNSSYGRASFAILLFQDLAVVPLLALVPLLGYTEQSIGEEIIIALAESVFILGLVVVIGRYFLHPVLHRVALSGNPDIFTASAVVIVLGTSLATEHAGLSMAMGAFLAGLLISDSFYRHQVIAEIQPFRGLLLGLFFMSMGMSLNLNLLVENPLFSMATVSLLMVLKISALFPITFLFGLKAKNGFAVSLVLAQGGEFALVLFSLAQQVNLLSSELFQQLLLIVLLSMMASPLLAQISQNIIREHEAAKAKSTKKTVQAPIVIAGFGRVGHRIGEILTQAEKPFVALDFNAALVDKESAIGYPVFYGDVRKAELLKSAVAGNAKVIIVTLDDPRATEEVVETLHMNYPEISIYARGHSLSECRKLRKLGATGVVSENIEASLELAHMTLTNIGVSQKKSEAILGGFRRTYQAQINDVSSLESEMD